MQTDLFKKPIFLDFAKAFVQERFMMSSFRKGFIYSCLKINKATEIITYIFIDKCYALYWSVIIASATDTGNIQ